jgi:hypothetical protein
MLQRCGAVAGGIYCYCIFVQPDFYARIRCSVQRLLQMYKFEAFLDVLCSV